MLDVISRVKLSVFQSSTKASESYTDDIGKDDDDDNDDDDDDKLPPGQNKDPERLKAFNVSTKLSISPSLNCSLRTMLICLFLWKLIN